MKVELRQVCVCETLLITATVGLVPQPCKRIWASTSSDHCNGEKLRCKCVTSKAFTLEQVFRREKCNILVA